MKQLAIYLLSIPMSIFAQEARISGHIVSEGEPLMGATIELLGTKQVQSSDEAGFYSFGGLEAGVYNLRFQALARKSLERQVELEAGQQLELDIELASDLLNLDVLVVSGNRIASRQQDAPVLVQSISRRSFEASQALSLSEGLSFSPGLRLENNCQNCGFTQVRMNGLDGAYSQVLINSRPVFSALAGVYGLEMLPVSMIDRVEVLRGGGSVLYGGNAIAGTINIITKDPTHNSFEFGLNQSFVGMSSPDLSAHANGSLVSKGLDKGLSFYGFLRNRKPWDADGDGFSEIVKLKTQSFGFDAFWNPSGRAKIKLGAYAISEFRRGGNAFELAAHQSDLAEQLQHTIYGTQASYEQYSKNYRHKIALYGAVQAVNRDSYYGGGGRILQEGDELTEQDILAINAYGQSNDISLNTGLQYVYDIDEQLLLTAGSEFQYNRVEDAMAGYQRFIDQRVGVLGNYAQLQYKPIRPLTILAGARFDYVWVNNQNSLLGEELREELALPVFVPRLALLYELHKDLRARFSFAQGYRAPQAFDEDLHIETVGGAARFIRLDPDLQSERSNSYALSLSYQRQLGSKQLNVVLEGFHTQLNNAFILSDQEPLANGASVLSKRNSSGALVQGLNLEANLALSSKLALQLGGTLQSARYQEEELIWEPEEGNLLFGPATTTRILRNPNSYGFLSFWYKPLPAFSFSLTGLYTGSMDLAHVVEPETEATVIKSSPSFFEANLKFEYEFTLSTDYALKFFAGMHNILNSFQRDFDRGPERDAGYIYGPTRPRSLFLGLKFQFN